jgi:hypothetical protein
MREMLQALSNKIDTKKVFVQLNISNLIKQILFIATQKTSKILSKKTLQTIYSILQNLHFFYKRLVFSYC